MAIDYRAAMERAGVTLPDDPLPPTPSEQMTADALGLRIEELGFARRLGVSPAHFAAARGIRSLKDFEAAQEELRRLRGA